MPGRQVRIAGFLIALLVIAVPGGVLAASAPAPRVTLRVDSVLAADTHEGMDARLGAIKYRLRSLFDYSTYRLLKHQEASIGCGKMAGFALPGGRILHVKALSIDGPMIAMELVLFEGARPIMTTDLKLMNHGVLMVGGPRYQQGMLIIAIAANAPKMAGTPKAQRGQQVEQPDSTTPVSTAP